MLTFVTVTKHGKSFLPTRTRTRTISRRSVSILATTHHTTFSSKSTTSTTKMHSISSSSTNQENARSSNLPPIFGGDYAGHSATFSPSTGKLIPVPEYYVPDSMVEWGQVPSCFEVIVSEDFVDSSTSLLLHDSSPSPSPSAEEDNSGSNTTSRNNISMDRCTVQIMPEVGCGLDNLDTMKVKESIPMSTCTYTQIQIPRKAEDDADGADDVQIGSVFIPDKSRLECIFTTIHKLVDDNNNHNNNHNKIDEEGDGDVNHITFRTRVGVNFFPSKLQIKSPMDIVQETKTSNDSSKGSIADGGGLDSRRVFNLMQSPLDVNKPFSEGEGIDLTSHQMVGCWKRHDDGILIERDGKYWNGNNDDHADNQQTILSLPGNVLIQYGEQQLSPLLLEISYVMEGKRFVIAREFELSEDEKIIESSTQHYWEEKV